MRRDRGNQVASALDRSVSLGGVATRLPGGKVTLNRHMTADEDRRSEPRPDDGKAMQ